MKKVNKDIKRIAYDKLFFMLMMFLWSSSTSPYFKIISAEVPYFSLLHFSIIIGYGINNLKFSQLVSPFIFYSIILVWWSFWCISHGIIVGTDVSMLTGFLAAFVAFSLYERREFFYYFEIVLVWLTVLSLIVWILGNIARPTMESVFDKISLSDGNVLCYGHIGIVGLGSQYAVGMTSLTRNLGFTWEAGRFSGFLVIGLFVNLILNSNHLSLKKNRHFWILFVGLISTFSTTGYGAALPIMLFYFYNKRALSIKLISPIVVFITIFVLWELDFFKKKILPEFDFRQELFNIGKTFEYGIESITPGRIVGAYLEFKNMIHDFWLGYNLNEFSYTNSKLYKGNVVWLSNGTLLIFSKYGIFVALYIYYNLFQSSRIILKSFKSGRLLLAVTVILINISYNYWESCLIIYITFYYLFVKYDTRLFSIYERKYIDFSHNSHV